MITTSPIPNLEKYASSSSDILDEIFDWVVKPLWGFVIAKSIERLLRKRRHVQQITIIEELVNKEKLDRVTWREFKQFADEKGNVFVRIALNSSEPGIATLLEIKRVPNIKCPSLLKRQFHFLK